MVQRNCKVESLQNVPIGSLADTTVTHRSQGENQTLLRTIMPIFDSVN